jgi:hypothetical protein
MKWILNSAKAIGLSHIDENIPCQDSVKTLTQNGVDVAVLSDGCGSAHFAEYGSALVVDKVSSYLVNNFDFLYGLSEIEVKKIITKVILDGVNEYVKNNINVINKYFETEKGKRNYNKVSNYEIMRLLSSLDAKNLLYSTLFDATILFVSIKDDKCLIGHCGDGFILGKQNDEFSVLSEEPKTGERNVTTYPSVIYYFSLGYKNDKEWNSFRIYKLNPNDYQGFTLMSDGAEKSLIRITNDISTPIKANNEILYQIVTNETEEDASIYLKEQLEQAYRERKNSNGDIVEITDDDVSIAIIAAIDEIDTNIDDTDALLNEPMYFDTALRKILTIGFYFNNEKYIWLKKVFTFLVKEYTKKPFDINHFKALLSNVFYADIKDINQIIIYGVKLKIINLNPFSIKTIGGDSSES